MTQELTVFGLGREFAAGACEPDRVLVQTLGMTPSIAWGVMKDNFPKAFNRKHTPEDKAEFTKGFKLGLLEIQRDKAERAIQELEQ